MFNFDRELFGGATTRLISSAKRSLQDRQRDVYDSHRHRVFALAYYMTGDEIRAEETLTRTFLRAFKSMEEPDSTAIDIALMGELRGQIAFDEPVSPVEVATEDSVGSRNVRRTELEEAIGELPPVERLVFLLRDVEGYSTQATSGFTGLPAADVPRILMSARLRMRSILASGVVASRSPMEAADGSSPTSEAA